MATKERIHELVDSLPDTPETEQRLDVIADELVPNEVVEEGPIPTLEEVFEVFSSIDFLPRDDAWH
jgi:hypothetical protein